MLNECLNKTAYNAATNNKFTEDYNNPDPNGGLNHIVTGKKT